MQQTPRADFRDPLIELGACRYPFLLALILALMVGAARVLS